MGSKGKKNSDELIEKKLNRTTNKIKKSRKNVEIAQKEAAEFEEIHRLLENSENDSFIVASNSSFHFTSTNPLEFSVIPLTSPGNIVFREELYFSLFNEESLYLQNFINKQEKCIGFGKDESFPSEEAFRKLILYRVAENLMPEEEKCSSISLYVLYLMSVHENYAFVRACYDYLNYHPFCIHIEDILPIFINFGINQEHCGFNGKSVLQKFSYNEKNYKRPENPKFPYFNVEMVGKILLYYITNNFIKISLEVKFFVKVLAKITLDPKVRSSSLFAIYSTILTVLSKKIKEDFIVKEIVNWLFFDEEHLLNQLEICRSVSRAAFPELHDSLVIKTICTILKSRTSPTEPPIKIDLIKYVLKRLKIKGLPLLEFYSLLQLINDSLPGISTTLEDSTEINMILVSLEKRISQTEDTVDLIRLKLELAKVRTLVANNINNRFTVDENLKTSVKET